MSKGLRINRRFTEAGKDPFDKLEWSRRDSRITNPDGSTVFEMTDAEIPAGWSQVASDIMVSKYFRKAGVPQFDDDGTQVFDESGQPVLGPERSAKQVFSRLAGTWRHWGEKEGYFATSDDAVAFEDELKYMLANQMAAPNSPQWFNTGLNWAYGLTGPAQGFWYVDGADGELKASPDSYSRPAPHACFILSVRDDLVNPGGIMDLWVREARIFKFGSGAGSNFSHIRAENERLSGGGKSSGVMSFLKIGDRAAGAIKSGGTTRRAAKMVILDVDHPDIERFIDWKKVEEDKARVLINHGGLPADFNGDAYATVSGQNSNNSVRVTNDFIQTVIDDGDWDLINRTDGSVRKTVKARDLWDTIAEAAWACADPGLQFDTTVNEWHTSPAGGRIRASNPCSEYMFLDDTACNLASINLVRFHDDETGVFDLEAYQHAVRLWTIVLEVSVAMAHFPSPEIAQGSYDYRTLGLGYANLGSLLMRQGIAYDSDEGRAISGALTAILTGYSYATSAEMAGVVGPFPRYAENREAMLRVIRNHRRAAYGDSDYEGVSHKVMAIDPDLCPPDFLAAARTSWDLALEQGEEHGYRNAQSSVIAPTGTIGLLMDCDTTGVEPDFALVKFKKLAGGGYFKIANQSVAPSLRHLGYEEDQIKDVVEYIVGTSSIDGAPHINRETLTDKGFDDEDLAKLEKALPAVFELKHAFNVFTFGESTLQRLGFGVDEYTGWEFNLLKALGFTIGGDQRGERPHLWPSDHRRRTTHRRRASRRLRHRQQEREVRHPVHPPLRAHQDDGGRPAVHLGSDQQDDQHAPRDHGRGHRGVIPDVLGVGPQGDGPLQGRVQGGPAAQLHLRRGRGQRGRVTCAVRCSGDREGDPLGQPPRRDLTDTGLPPGDEATPVPAPGPSQRVQPGGEDRRAQGVPPHRRVRRRDTGRDLHRPGQGGGDPEGNPVLLRHRRLQGPPVRGAARGVRRHLHLPDVRAEGHGRGSSQHQDGQLDRGLRVPGPRCGVPGAGRARPGPAGP